MAFDDQARPAGAFVPTRQGDDALLALDVTAAQEAGRDLADAYQAAKPFPHAVIDDFLPREVVDYCLDHFPRDLDADGMAFDRDQERYKRSFQPDNLDDARLRELFYTFNSRPFIRLVENVTGIKGLIPDPYFVGGGFHEIGQGGHLSVHADFNHHKPMNVERRVNVLIYLNDGWEDAHGGQLELWNEDVTERVRSVVPIANRCVMFSTTGRSFHGNPNPIDHPDGQTRKSIALYYYTSTWDDSKKAKTTQFKPRPGTEDRPDWKVRTSEVIDDWVPPKLAGPVKGLVGKLVR